MDTEFSRLLGDELPHLWRFGYRLCSCPDISQELIQKTILMALEKRHQLNDDKKLRSWLFAIMHSIWKNDLRAKSTRQNLRFDSVFIDQLTDNANRFDNVLLLNEVMEQVNSLPEEQRTIMILVCVEGYSYKDTAEILDIPIGTVMSRLSRARLVIGEKFSNFGQENNAANVLNLCRYAPGE